MDPFTMYFLVNVGISHAYVSSLVLKPGKMDIQAAHSLQAAWVGSSHDDRKWLITLVSFRPFLGLWLFPFQMGVILTTYTSPGRMGYFTYL